nr:hypothetical protein Itr_chr13CG13620 [Ipomoea trifida]
MGCCRREESEREEGERREAAYAVRAPLLRRGKQVSPTTLCFAEERRTTTVGGGCCRSRDHVAARITKG